MSVRSPGRRIFGTTMIELVAALGVLFVACLALATVMTGAATLNKDTMDETAKVYAAQQKIDDLMLANAVVGPTFNDTQKDYPFGTNVNCFRRWRGLIDSYGNNVVQVDIVWTVEARTRTLTLYGMVSP